jgi:MFS family permease
VIFSVTLMAILGVASVTPAFPTIAQELDISPQAVGLLISVFTVPGVLLTPVVGVLADRYGRKTFLVPSLFVFATAGAACSFARDFELLLVLRLLQGVGAAALGALNLTIMGDLYSGIRRATALGYNASVLSIGTAAYPIIGGALATVAWYAPFFLPVLGFPVGLLVLFVLDTPRPSVEPGLGSYFRKALRAITRAEVLVFFGASIVTFILIYGTFLTFLPFLLQHRFGASALSIGLAMAATSLATGVASWQRGRLAARFGERRRVVTGFVCYVVAIIGIPLAGSVWLLMLPVLLFGVANGINIPSIISILTGAASAQNRAALLSVHAMLLRLGQTLGPVLVGLAFQTLGLSAAFYASAGLAAAMLVVLAVAVPSLGPQQATP